MTFVIQLKMQVKYHLIIGFPCDLEFDDIHFVESDTCFSICGSQKKPVAGVSDRILIRGTVQYSVAKILLQLFHLSPPINP